MCKQIKTPNIWPLTLVNLHPKIGTYKFPACNFSVESFHCEPVWEEFERSEFGADIVQRCHSVLQTPQLSSGSHWAGHEGMAEKKNRRNPKEWILRRAPI